MRAESLTMKGRSPHWRPRRSALALELRMLFDGAAAATVEQQQDASDPLPDFQDATQPADTQSVAADVQVQPGTAEVSEASLTDQLTDPSSSDFLSLDSGSGTSGSELRCGAHF